MSQTQTPYRRPFRKGAVRAASLVEKQIRKVGESRGFAVSRLLTHWQEVAGEELAAIARPVKVSYSRGGIGGTLVLLTTGANAQFVEMQKEKLKERVNVCYGGYGAIRRIHVTQTAPTGFSETATPFTPAPPRVATRQDAAAAERARETADGVSDPGLRAALENLGRNVLSPRTDRKDP